MGTVVISLDAERAWGFHDLEGDYARRIRRSPMAWEWLIEAFERYELPATWAIVGHLFLTGCPGEHEDHPAGPEWFAADPGGAAAENELWFCPDVIERIQHGPIDHEIGSHSFSHVLMGRDSTTPAIAAAELEFSQRAAASMDINLDSFVFPRGSIGHLSALADHGFRYYRGPQPGRDDESALTANLPYFLKNWRPALVTPEVRSDGLVNVPGSLALFSVQGLLRKAIHPIVGDPMVQVVENGLDLASQRGEEAL